MAEQASTPSLEVEERHVTNIPLKALGLEKRWPRLAALQAEISDLEGRLHKARGAVHQAQGQLGPARERDLQSAGKAIRARKAVPEPEPAVQAELEAADRMAEQVSRALQSAREDLGNFLAAHQGALHADVVQARRKVADRLAEYARACLADYSRHEDLGRTVHDLTPAEPLVEGAPAQRLTTSIIGVNLSPQSSAPPRGRVEQVLQHLIALAPAEEESGDDAAA